MVFVDGLCRWSLSMVFVDKEDRQRGSTKGNRRHYPARRFRWEARSTGAGLETRGPGASLAPVAFRAGGRQNPSVPAGHRVRSVRKGVVWLTALWLGLAAVWAEEEFLMQSWQNDDGPPHSSGTGHGQQS